MLVYWLCDLGPVIQPLCVLVSLSINEEEENSVYFEGHWEYFTIYWIG